MKVVLITAHGAEGGRKTGLHFWADIMSKRGIMLFTGATISSVYE